MQQTINTKAHAVGVFIWFKVEVRGATLDGIQQSGIDKFDDGRIVLALADNLVILITGIQRIDTGQLLVGDITHIERGTVTPQLLVYRTLEFSESTSTGSARRPVAN